MRKFGKEVYLRQCPLCNGSECDSREVYHGPARLGCEIRQVVCLRCGLCYQNPRPTGQALDDYYANKYRRTKPAGNARAPRETIGKYNGRRADYVVDVIERYTTLGKDASILEIGFGIGSAIYQLAKHGYTRISGGWSPLASTMKGWGFGGGKWDLVILHHVLEHIPLFSEALGSTHQLLKPGGYIFIAVPDIFWPRDGWQNFFIKPHLSTFSRKALSILWSEVGLHVRTQGYYHQAVWQLLQAWDGPGRAYRPKLANETISWVTDTPGNRRNMEMIPDSMLNYPIGETK